MQHRVRLAQAQPAPTLRISLFACLLLAGAVLSQAAFAASDSFINCDRLTKDLRSLDVPDSELPVEDVEHMTAQDAEALGGPLKARLFASDTVAPVLLLAPRVASIMRDIFNAALPGHDADEESSAMKDLPKVPPASAPVVSAPKSRQPDFEPPPADDSGNSERFLPRFQRRMYRTDI